MISKSFKIIILLLFLSFVFTAGSERALASKIQGSVSFVEDTLFGIGDGFHFQFDRKGVPSVSYYDRNRNQLRFARVSKGKWITETAAPAGYAEKGYVTSLAFDGFNNPYIAFYGVKGNLQLAVKRDNKWIIEDIDEDKGSGTFCSLALTAGGDPAVAYQGPEGTMYARRLVGSWYKEKIDSSGGKTKLFINREGDIAVYYKGFEKSEETPSNGGEALLIRADKKDSSWNLNPFPDSQGCSDFDVEIDQSGSPVISYIRDKKIQIYRETIPGSSIWKEYQVGTEDSYALSLSLKMNGFPSIVYISDKGQDMKVARFNGTDWDVRQAASARAGYSFERCQIVQDKKDQDLIILYDGDAMNVFLQKDQGWGLGRVDGRSRRGGYINLLLDKKGIPYLSYYDFTNKELYFASKINGVWQPEIVDRTGDVGRYASAAVDSKGNPFIAYYDALRGDLKYAWKEGKYWKWERVNNDGDTGVNCSLQIDSSDNPHIAYRSVSGRALLYSYKKGNKWIAEEVSRLGEYAQEAVLLIDSRQRVRIVYVDGHKVDKPAPGESPVKNSIRLATRVSDNKWYIEELTGPYAAEIEKTGLSAHMNPNNEIAVSYLDREGRLTVLRSKDEVWEMDTFNAMCLPSTSIKYQKDETLAVVYLEGKSVSSAVPYAAILRNGQWEISQIDIPDAQMGEVSIASSPDGLIRFAYSDLIRNSAAYFTQKP